MMLKRVLLAGTLALGAITSVSAQEAEAPALILNGQAQVVVADIGASNGVIHVVDAVLVPPEDEGVVDDIDNAANAINDAMRNAAETVEAELSEASSVLGQALEEASESIIESDIGQQLTQAENELNQALNEAREAAGPALEQAEEAASNVLNEAGEAAALAFEGARQAIEQADFEITLPGTEDTIADVLEASPEFSQLTEALKAAGIFSALDLPGSFTLFAPTNDAFDALLAGQGVTLEELAAEPGGLLINVLSYHIVSGEYLATELAELDTITAINGAEIVIVVEVQEATATPTAAG